VNPDRQPPGGCGAPGPRLPCPLGLVPAVVVLRAPSGRWENRVLALLVTFATLEIGFEFGLELLVDDTVLHVGFNQVQFLLVAARPWIYLAFLGT
jgi:hypothetical protein